MTTKVRIYMTPNLRIYMTRNVRIHMISNARPNFSMWTSLHFSTKILMDMDMNRDRVPWFSRPPPWHKQLKACIIDNLDTSSRAQISPPQTTHVQSQYVQPHTGTCKKNCTKTNSSITQIATQRSSGFPAPHKPHQAFNGPDHASPNVGLEALIHTRMAA